MDRVMTWLCLALPLLLLLVAGCQGEEAANITHLILIDDLPPTFSKNSTPEIVIRTNYSGKVEFREAEEFKVLLTITAPSIQDAYAISSQLVDDKGKLLLQVFEKPTTVWNISLPWIFILIAGLGGIAFVIAVTYVGIWYSDKKYQGLFGGQRDYLARGMYRSRNSMQLGAAADLLGDVDQHDDDGDGDEDNERERRKMEKLRVGIKPETIPEESEDSADDDKTNPKTRFQVSSRQIHREWSLRQRDRQGTAAGPGGDSRDYQDQSGDEFENDLSPDQRIADANGSYTPLDELDDLGHDHQTALMNSRSVAKLIDPRGNLDYNIQTSKSDGDLLGDNKKMSEKEKVIPPLTVIIPKTKKGVPAQRRAEPNEYQRGLNLRRNQENDLSSSPARADRTQVQVHTPENLYANSSFGQYIALQTPTDSARSRLSRESNDAYELYRYPDIPMSTFKSSGSHGSPYKSPVRDVPKVKPKPVFESGSPGGFDFHKLDPKLEAQRSNDPVSPGNFSMLSEGSDSDSLEPEDDMHPGFYKLDDSDLDIPPPLRDEDGVSNASLPLPSPPPMSNQFMPYDTHGHISQLSPRQSLVSPGDSNQYGTCIALTGSPSPGGPFSKHSVAQDGNRFVFPPPPVMYTPAQQSAFRRELNFQGEDGAGEYASLPMDTTQGGLQSGQGQGQGQEVRRDEASGGRERRQSGGRERKQSFGKKGRPPKFLHLNVIMTCCLLGLLSGVYCALSPKETKVDIVIYVPANYPYKNSTIYSAIGKTVDVQESDGMDWFLSREPILRRFNSTLCGSNLCEHGCDDNNGDCLCRHGYMKVDGQCEDINECQNGMARCSHPHAGCANTPGSYDCLCMGGFKLYKYKNMCLECSAPCRKGTYEFQKCVDDTQKKICKDCTKSCGDDYFMRYPCTKNKDAVCHKCNSRCNATTEFEFTQCSAIENRECKDKTSLKAPVTSSNMILDDLTVVRDEKVEIPHVPTNFKGVSRFNFERGMKGFGSDFWIEVEIKHFKPVGQFRSVDHSDDMDVSQFPGSKAIPAKFCPYPVPMQYELSYEKHDQVSYRQNKGKFEFCASDPGNFPEVKDESLLCSEPGPLSEAFQGILAKDFETTKTVWEEQSIVCKKRHEECENCSIKCIQDMAKTNSNCSVTVSDENGRSPRLPYCYQCCSKRDCERACQSYHNSRCRMIRCQRGNLVQFQLKSIYPPAMDNFYCHIEPILHQHLITVEYKVKFLQWSNTVYLPYRNLTVYSDKEWQKTGKTFKKDDVIQIEVDSQLRKIPDFLQWAVGGHNIRVGKYHATGIPLKDTLVSAQNVMVRPLEPMGINPVEFQKSSCDNDYMKSVLIATDQDGPYQTVTELFSMFQGNATYLVTNKTLAPSVRISLNRNTSILKAIFNTTKVKYGSLQGNLTYNSSYAWNVIIVGEVEECPGFFNLNISDAAYPDDPLFQFDVGVECPHKFHIKVAIPTGDSPLLSKDLLVHVRDMSGTYLLRIYAPAQITMEEMDAQIDEPDVYPTDPVPAKPDQEEPAHFSILFIAVVAGLTTILLFLLIFGVAWKQGVPDRDIQRFHLRHLVLLVVYVTFQLIYSAVVSMTVFVLIVIAVNGETTSFLQQYNQQRSVTTALSQLELDTMVYHLETEFQRQNSESREQKAHCYNNIQRLIQDVQRLRVSIETDAINKLQRDNLRDLIVTHTKTTLDEFSKDLLKFRQNYDKYEQYVLHKLQAEMNSTYESIENSKWLRGARFLYDIIGINKKLHGGSFDTGSFMDWVKMETDMMKLAKELTLPLPDLPNLSRNFEDSLKNHHNARLTPSLEPMSSQTLNQWFVHQEAHRPLSNKTQDVYGRTKRVSTLKGSSYTVFIVFMVIIDILYLTHRMVKACGIAKLLLYGYPIYIDVRDQKEGPNQEEKKKTNKKSKWKFVGVILNKMLSTYFIPKLIGTLFVCLMVYFVTLCAYKFINRDTFTYMGYYNDLEGIMGINRGAINARILSHTDRINRLEFPMYESVMNVNFQNHQHILNLIETQWRAIETEDIMKINRGAINTRILSHADRINRMEFPMYESVMNVNVQNHQHILNLIETQWRAIETAHTRTYCSYLRKINVTASCHVDDTGENTLTEVRLQGCAFPPVVPKFYERSMSASSRIAEEQMDGFLRSLRRLVMDTCYIIIVYLAVIVIKQLLGTVLWIYIKRSGFVSLRIIYETDEAPGSADSSTTNK